MVITVTSELNNIGLLFVVIDNKLTTIKDINYDWENTHKLYESSLI